jgi:hypothetical protein
MVASFVRNGSTRQLYYINAGRFTHLRPPRLGIPPALRHQLGVTARFHYLAVYYNVDQVGLHGGGEDEDQRIPLRVASHAGAECVYQ